MTMTHKQCADTVVMVRPAAFAANPQTKSSNAFQRAPLADDNPQIAALKAFEQAAATLAGAGVRVVIVDDAERPLTPDAIFPNNWFTTHPDGRLVLYPMFAENRRWERRPRALVDELESAGFHVTEIVDMTAHEHGGAMLEGTGSMVLDRVARCAYMAESARASTKALDDFCRRLGFGSHTFQALDEGGLAIYHTNVMMSVGERFAVVGLSTLRDSHARDALRNQLEKSGKAVIDLTFAEIQNFAGNLLQLARPDGSRLIALSEQAFEGLSQANKRALATHGELLALSIESIERLAGGSIRCMLAEVFLPRRSATQ